MKKIVKNNMGDDSMKINDLYEVNILNEKAKLLLNNSIDNDFYDFYFENGADWLKTNKKKIEEDFNNNVEKMKFDIIVNSNLDERITLIKSLKNDTIEEFENYICLPTKSERKYLKELKKVFKEFKTIDDDYLLVNYFNRICR